MYKIKYRAILDCSNYPRYVSGFSAGINVLANTVKKKKFLNLIKNEF